jgi:ribosomal protein S18 acetylase RimI-like enzyme
VAHGELTSRPLRSRVRLRRPVEGDHRPIASLVDEWWGGRRIRASLPRLWFRHFARTSWIAEDDSGGTAGFLVGFVSPDRPDEALVHLVGVDPNLRRRGIGTELVEAFAEDVAARGARRVTVIVPPDDRVALDFLRALGFQALDGPGTVRLYGSPSFPDYEGEREDRAVLVRER